MENFSSLRRWTIFAIVATGNYMALLSATSVNVALPIIEQEFAASLSGIQWVVTGYLLVISSVLPVFGWAGDSTQRKYVIALGFLVFGLGSFLCAQVTSLAWLIIFRLIQGLGASMNMANSYAAITNAFPANERGKALGLQGSMVALGSISGPAVGGFLLEYFSWDSIFYINLPFAAIGFFMAMRYIPKTPARQNKSFDLLGAFLMITSLSFFIISISQWGRPGWSDVEIAGYMLLSLLLFYLFLRWEARTPTPLVEVSMFHNKTFLNGNLAGLCSFLALNSHSMLLPFYLHQIINASPKTMGLILMVFPVMMIITAPISGSLSDRYGTSLFAVSGMSLMATALILLIITAHWAESWTLAVILGLLGASNGIFQSPNNVSTLSVVPVEKHGMAGSMVALMRNLGSVVGIALSVRICDKVADIYLAGRPAYETIANDAFIAGYQAAIALGVCFAFAGLTFSFIKKRNLTESDKP